MKLSKWRLRCAMFAWTCLALWYVTEGVTITPVTKAAKLKEKETTAKELARVRCSPTPPATLCSVSIASVFPSTPCGNCFALYTCDPPISKTETEFCLRYLPGQGTLNPMVAERYSLTLRASDGNDQKATIVDVHIDPNSPPFFDPRDYSQLNIKRKLSSTNPVQIRARDLDSDALTFSMTLVPPVDGLRIDASASSSTDDRYMSATISPTKDLRSLCRSTLAALVYVKDDYHSDRAGPLAITLDLDKPNDRPFITNLNTDLYVRENEKIGTTVYNLATFDKIQPNPLEYTVTTSPSSAADLFKLPIDPKTHDLIINKDLDYETYRNGITMTIKVSDGFCESETYVLRIKVVDMNEPPTLLPIDQTVDSCEGNVTIRPRWTNISDPDDGDVVRFTAINPNDNGRFHIDEKTGVVSTTIDYDVDVSGFAPTVVNKIVLSDRQGETATATLTIRFEDCNDNAPLFTVPARDYTVRDCWEPDTVVGNVFAAVDRDSTYRQNNVFSYSGSATGVQVLASGAIVIKKKFSAGETVTFAAYATDKGQVPGPLKSKPFWVSLHTMPCVVPPTVPPTDNSGSGNRNWVRFRFTETLLPANDIGFWDPDGPNLGWLIPLLLLAIPLLGLPFFLLWRYWGRVQRCWANRRPCCPPKTGDKREPPRRPGSPDRRPTPPPEPQGPGFIFGWWKETYRDNDYERTPNRKALPEPSKGPEALETNTYDLIEKEPPPVMAASPPPPQRSSRCNIL